jgi:hypothetical protein
MHRTSGSQPEDFRAYQTANGQTALVTATGGHQREDARLEVMRVGSESDFTTGFDVKDRPEMRDFAPHGICVVPSSTAPGWEGKKLLYAANAGSRSGRASIEVFEALADRFVHLATLGSANQPNLKSINAVTALPNGMVFATVFGALPSVDKERSAYRRLIVGEKLKRDTVVQFQPAVDGNPAVGQWSAYEGGWGGANGIGFAQQQQALLVAGFHHRRITVVPLTKSGQMNLAGVRRIPLRTHPDNLTETAEGTWMACTTPNTLGSGLRLLLESGLSISVPYFLRPALAVEFDVTSGAIVSSRPIPRCLSSPSTVWRLGSTYFTSRILAPVIAEWSPRP